MAARSGVEVTGLDLLARRLREFGRNVNEEFGRALYAEAELIMTEAKKRTPVDTGTLRESGHVDPPRYRGRDIEVDLIFGGAARGYAIYVHENVSAHHKVGQAKFLSSAVEEAVGTLAAKITERVRRRLRWS